MSKECIIKCDSNLTIVRRPNELLVESEGKLTISDGYHTMDELYEHRMILFVCLLNVLHNSETEYVWKSREHSDASPMFEGMFIAGIGANKGEQITYHLDNKYWDMLYFNDRIFAPEYDGHTSKDVLERLEKLSSLL